MPTWLAIINPEAGRGRCGRMATSVIARLRKEGLPLEVWYTRGPGHAVELAADAHRQGFRDFIAVGGDGTCHEIVNGLGAFMGAQDDTRVRLGFLPLGTGNSFVRDFMVPELDGLVLSLLRHRRRPCDAIRVTHDGGELFFLNIFSFGFVADVCEMANAQLKGLGAMGYVGAVVAKLAGISSLTYRMQLDETPRWEQRALVLTISNSQYTGGQMHIAPYADTADGEMDVMLVGELSRAVFVKLFAKIFTGDHVHHSAVTTSRARRIRFDFPEPVSVMVDGEVTTIRPRTMEVMRHALDVVI